MERMMLKEFAAEEGRAIWLHFNPLRSSDKTGDDAELFELAVSLAASVAYHGRDIGIRMIFSAPGLRLAPHAPEDHVRAFLAYLAEVEIGPGRLRREAPRPPRRRGDESLLVIDPLNDGLAWAGAFDVLDRRYLDRLAHLDRKADK
jgi:uncharacterized protein (DUF58 family)